MDNLQNDYSIIFSHVQKAYGSNVVINDLNLNIRKGERLILLGYNVPIVIDSLRESIESDMDMKRVYSI